MRKFYMDVLLHIISFSKGLMQKTKGISIPGFMLLLLLSMANATIFAQAPATKTIKGIVLDENGKPVIGASVSIPKTNR